MRLSVLPWVAIGVAVLALIATVVVKLLLSGSAETNVAYGVGQWIGALIFAGLLGGILYLVTGRSARSSRLGTIAFITVMSFSLVIRVATIGLLRDPPPSPAAKVLLADMQRLSQSITTDIQTSGNVDVDARLGEFQRLVDARKSDLNDSEIALFRGSVDVMRRSISSQALYSVPLQRFLAAGAIDMKNVTEQSEVKARLALLTNVDRGLSDAKREFGVTMDDVENAYIRAGVRPARAKEACTSARRVGELQMQFFLNQERLCASMREVLTLLDTRWGKWQHDGELLRFDTDEDLATFQRVAETLQREATEENRLMNLLKQAQKL